MVEAGRVETRLLQAPAARVDRKGRIVFLTGEPLLLRRRDDVAVDDKTCRGVVIVRRDAKNGGHASAGSSR